MMKVTKNMNDRVYSSSRYSSYHHHHRPVVICCVLLSLISLFASTNHHCDATQQIPPNRQTNENTTEPFYYTSFLRDNSTDTDLEGYDEQGDNDTNDEADGTLIDLRDDTTPKGGIDCATLKQMCNCNEDDDECMLQCDEEAGLDCLTGGITPPSDDESLKVISSTDEEDTNVPEEDEPNNEVDESVDTPFDPDNSPDENEDTPFVDNGPDDLDEFNNTPPDDPDDNIDPSKDNEDDPDDEDITAPITGIDDTDDPIPDNDHGCTSPLTGCISSYPGYQGDPNVLGTVTVDYPSTLNYLELTWDLEGVKGLGADACGVEGCGIHIHEGTSCDDAGDHYWNRNHLSEDPWKKKNAGFLYTSSSDGSAAGSNTLSNGYSCDDINGHVVVVHGDGGVRIACGVINDNIPADNCFSPLEDNEDNTPFVDNGPDDDDQNDPDSPFYNGPDEDGPDEDDEFNTTPVDDPTMSPITTLDPDHPDHDQQNTPDPDNPDHNDDYYAYRNDDNDTTHDNQNKNPTKSPVTEGMIRAPTPTPTNNSDPKTAKDYENEGKTFVNNEEKELDSLAHNKTADVLAALFAIFGFFGMIFTAWQLLENPDGLCTSCCRLTVKAAGCLLKIVFLPCRLCCSPYKGYSGTNDPRDPNNNSVFDGPEMA